MTENEPMSLDDNVEPIDSLPAKDVDGIPYCQIHHCRMKKNSGGNKGSRTTYYKCQVAGCDEGGQRIRTKQPRVVPENPQACPRCTKGKKPTYCERDANSSTAAMVVLKCPDCGWKSTAMAVPQLAAAHFAAKQRMPLVENVGDR